MYYTAQDLVEYLFATTSGGAQDGEHRLIRSAIHHAYRDLINARDWTWHATEGEITLVANVTKYNLPHDIKSIDALIPQDRTAITAYISPNEYKRLEVNKLALGEPVYWTIMRDTDAAEFDRWEIRVAGKPPAGTKLYFIYRRRPAPLKWMGVESVCRVGTVSTDGTSTTVTGAGTAFPACAGAIIRFGTPDVEPESLTGIHPYADQQKIASVQGSNALTLLAAPAQYTDVKYTISDLLDVSPAMYTALISGAEMWLARLLGKSIEGTAAMYERDLRLAFEADVLTPISGQRGPIMRNPDAAGPRYAGWNSPSLPDTGS